MSEIKKTIQKNIAVYRKKANLTQKELAQHIGVAPTSLASWEQGKSSPDIDTLFALCNALNVNIMDIYGFESTSRYSYGDGVDAAFADAIHQINDLANQSVRAGVALANDYSSDERQLVNDYRELNQQGQEYIRQTMYMAKQAYKKTPSFPSVENEALA